MSGTNRREFLRAAGMATAAVMAGVTGCAAQPQSTKLESVAGIKPRNVVFILSDDHRYDFMGFMRKVKFLETPNMDRMAREGAHLKNAFVTTALCSPSRASVLTGKLSHRHGVVDNNTDIPKGTVFFPQYLQQAGYQTAFLGKWHMGGETDQPRPGFDKWVSFRGQGVYMDPLLNIDGKQQKVRGYVTDILTDLAVEWLEKGRDTGKPFFLYLSHKAVHAEFTPAPRHKGRYADAEVEWPASMADTEDNYKGKPRWVREQRNSWHGVDYAYHGQMDIREFYKQYCETLLGVDDSIGRVLKCLEELGLDRSTLVMYMGDNGFLLGEHGLIDKRCAYEESMRVPMLARCPELIAAGTKVEKMVQNIDIAPTVLEAAGLKIPAEMDGISILNLLRGRQETRRDAIFYEYYWERNFPQTPTVHAIRTDRYKYMHYHGIWDADELYDLHNDPTEMNNLIDDPDHKELVKQLNKRLFDWLEKTEGMLIPLRRDSGNQMNKQKPKELLVTIAD